jgi:hypothetical protein
LVLADTGQLAPESLVDRFAEWDWSEAEVFEESEGCAAPPAAGVASALADPCEAQAISTKIPLKFAVFISGSGVLADAVGELVLASGWLFVCGLVGVCGVVWAAATPNASDKVSMHNGAFI